MREAMASKAAEAEAFEVASIVAEGEIEVVEPDGREAGAEVDEAGTEAFY